MEKVAPAPKTIKFFPQIKPFTRFACLSNRREVNGLKKINWLQWVLRLIRRDMKDVRENAEEKRDMYDLVRKKLKR